MQPNKLAMVRSDCMQKLHSFKHPLHFIREAEISKLFVDELVVIRMTNRNIFDDANGGLFVPPQGKIRS